MQQIADHLDKRSVVSKEAVDGYADVGFFYVGATPEANKEHLQEMLKWCLRSQGLNLLDGKEHSFIEIGGHIGDQGLALRLMGLGACLGLWTLLTPMSVIGVDNRSNDGIRLIGQGMVTIQAASKLAPTQH